jgi:cytochrome c oxidase subunit 3
MASFTPTVAMDDPRTNLGGAASRDFDARLRRARLGMGVAVAGIVMIFVSFTSAYVVRQGLPTIDPRTGTLVRDWIPVRLPALLLVNTCVLLLSSLTIALARRQVSGEVAVARATSVSEVSAASGQKISWLALTVVLGLSFLTLQWMAWRELAASGFYVATSPSSSFVYLLTGMHGVHLIGGVVALLVAGAASVLRRPVSSRLVILDVTGWYWHFMALLWVYILCLLEFAR